MAGGQAAGTTVRAPIPVCSTSTCDRHPGEDRDPVRFAIRQPRSAASMVFTSSIVIVIGPTPPGTGVIQPATSDDGL